MKVKARVCDLVDILRQVDLVKSSTLLTATQKQTVFQEMLNDLPLEMFSHNFQGTRAVMVAILTQEIKNGSTKSTPKKVPTKAKSVSPKSPKEELLRDPDVNTRRTRTKKAVVN